MMRRQVLSLCVMWLAVINRAIGVPCSQCPAETRKQIDLFCKNRDFGIFIDACRQMLSQNTDQDLITKACHPLGVCGYAIISCETCPGQFKHVLTTLCDSLTGRLDFGFWSTPFSDACKLLVWATPLTFFDKSCVIGQGIVREHSWGYRSCNGPANWAKGGYSKGCTGLNQSPINLDSGIAPTSATLLSFSSSYPTALSGTLNNNGRTLAFTVTSAASHTVTGSAVNGNVYTPFEIKFRWGSTNTKGSEHTIDGKASALEMQVLHRNTKYSTIADALGKNDGISVLAFLFKVDSTNTIDIFKTEIGQITAAANQQTKSVTSTVALDTFLKAVDLKGFYKYKGSLTVPACNGNVDWVVFDKELAVSQAQMDELRKLKDLDGNLMADNFRTPQSVSGRKVLHYKAN